MKRRDFIKDSAVSALAVGTAVHAFEPETFGSERSPISLPQAESKGPFWPEGARLVVSISMQMEAGAQPLSGAESPMPKLDPRYPDPPAIKWYEYGFKEGLPRLLDMFDCRSSPGSSQRDRPARARSLWPRTNVGRAIFHDARAGARIVQTEHREH